ncbi:MAG: T9SS type A sorting domain-containing protein, partial [Spirosomaceae bacterium]|nr:T9SS type A sorting domain-containing protein [Spirosomataceae bacterium]
MKIKSYFTIAFVFAIQFTFAQWTSTSKPANPISAANELQRDAKFSTDSLGNSYYVWADYRNNKTELFAQKLNSLGSTQWVKDGVRVGVLAENYNLNLRFTPKIIKPDGSGGALILWHQYYNISNTQIAYLFLQHIDSKGITKWDGGFKASDLSLGSTDENSELLDVVLQNNSYKILFNKHDAGNEYSFVYLAEVASNNVRSEDFFLIEKRDLKGGFDDKKNQIILIAREPDNSYSYYKGSMSAPKSIAKTPNLIPQSGTHRIDMFKFDSEYNTYIGRTETNGGEKKVFTQKINSDGRLQWGTNGYGFGDNVSFDIQVVPLSDGGGIATWIRDISPVREFRVARFRANGSIIWQKEVVKANPGLFLPNKLVADGADGVFTLWFTDNGSGGANYTVQRIDKDGNLVFGENGKVMEGWSGFTDYRLLAHPKGGCLAIFGASPTNGDLKTFDLFINKFNNDGSLGIKSTILIDNSTKREFSVNENLDVKLQLGGDGFLPNNIFTVNLLNRQFRLVRVLGSSESSPINVKIPNDIIGADFLLEVVSSSPKTESEKYQVRILEAPIPPIISSSQSVYCSGSRIQVLASACGGTVKWMDNSTVNPKTVTINNETEFWATCIQNGKESLKSNVVKIGVVIQPAAAANNSGPFLEGEEIKLTSSGGNTYEWKGPNGFTSTVQSPTISSATPQNGGIYTVTVSNKTQVLTCSATATTEVKINLILSTDDESLGLIKIYPNPASEQILIDSNEEYSYQIFDFLGRIVKQNTNLKSGNIEIKGLKS